jgi:FlaA1/EpsC-like NDP-sugar epimerase
VRDASNLGGEIEVVFTGMRPGEKMFEELVIGAELRPTAHPAVMRAQETMQPWAVMEPQLGRLEALLSQHDQVAVRNNVMVTALSGANAGRP